MTEIDSVTPIQEGWLGVYYKVTLSRVYIRHAPCTPSPCNERQPRARPLANSLLLHLKSRQNPPKHQCKKRSTYIFPLDEFVALGERLWNGDGFEFHSVYSRLGTCHGGDGLKSEAPAPPASCAAAAARTNNTQGARTDMHTSGPRVPTCSYLTHGNAALVTIDARIK